MNLLKAEVVKRSCAFVMHILEPVETLRKLALFFQDRRIVIDNLQMHRYRDGDANLVIHCQVEKDRVPGTLELLEKLPGVMEVEMLK